MLTPPIRIAILGFGHHAERRLVPAFARSTKTALAGLWRRNATQAKEDAARLGIPHFDSAEALCASSEVDAIFITSPDANHLADALLAFRHGKAVLCEKPLAMNAGQARAMLGASEAAGCLFGVGQNFRFNRSLELMRNQIAAGRIGKPLLAHAQYCYAGTSAPRKWITDPTLACGGPIADVGVHSIDALRFVLDDDVRSISVLASQDEASGEVEATATLQMQMRRGTFANVTASARSLYRTLIEVTGTKGVLIAENGLTVDRPIDIMLRQGGNLVETWTLSNDDGYVRMLDSFAGAMRGDGTFPCSGADGLINQQVLDAAFRSWHSGLREPL